ncbi:hypothetical protein [Neobacillus drentensis]|uniref:hypothetical protein n=1 Tax=Neobacillus drentensis TaxID=220684 RepID=UPI002FFF4318
MLSAFTSTFGGASSAAGAKAADEKFQNYQKDQQHLLPSPEEERRKKFDVIFGNM